MTLIWLIGVSFTYGFTCKDDHEHAPWWWIVPCLVAWPFVLGMVCSYIVDASVQQKDVTTTSPSTTTNQQRL